MEALTLGVTYLIVFAFGATFGSFVNVVVYRVPAKLSILWPPSRCLVCLHKLGKRENIPILGWLLLKGRCRHCRSHISRRYPIVEAITGALFLLVFWQFDATVQTLGYWAFLSWLLTLSLIDWDTMTLPNPLTQSGLVAGLLFQGTVGFFQASPSIGVAQQLMFGIVGAVIGIWLLDIIRLGGTILFKQEAMGDADPYLAAMMGAWLGWKYLLIALFLACAIGAFGGGGAIALGVLSRRQQMPFGPCLAMGAALTVFFGEVLLASYLRIFFPLS